MPFQTDNILPSGGMDADKDLSIISKGDYAAFTPDGKIGTLNIQHITDGGSTSFAIQNTRGNIFRFGINPTVAQNKIYRVLIQTVGTTSRTVTFYKTDGSVWVAVTYADNATLATARTNFSSAVTSALGGLTPTQAVTITIDSFDSLYMDVELTTTQGYEYSLASTGVNPTTVNIVQEPYDKSLVGNAQIIGSYDLLGQLYIWSTSQINLPSVLPALITGATNATPIVITANGHGLTNGTSIVISEVLGNTAANGVWIVTASSANTFTLANSVGNGGYTSGGIITINAEGVGEVGVAIYDANTDLSTYYTLIKSKELNFRREKQIDTYCEQNNFETSIYWTDNYNVPRVLYYSGAFMQFGSITVFNRLGKYAYGSINDETKLILSTELIGFSFKDQLQAGGAVKSGNWRYAVRLLTSAFAATNWTDLSNPINVYTWNNTGTDVRNATGNNSLVITSKINEFTVSNLIGGLFQYIELAAVNYVDDAIVGSIVNRFNIDASTMTIQHTGNEANVVNLDIATLNQVSFDIETAKNIDAIDNRLILSNLTTSAQIDFSGWTAQWTHTLFKKSINSVRYSEVNLRYAEYLVPENVNGFVGYMLNETYRFFAKFRLKSGFITNSFWIDDVKFDTTTPARRNGTFSNYDLTDSAGNTVYIPAITFETIDFNFFVNGLAVKDLVDEIFIERVECVPEILASGLGVLAIEGTTGPIADPDESIDGSSANFAATTTIGEHPPYYTDGGAAIHSLVYGSYANTTKHADFISLYCPDIMYGNTAYSFLSGDVLVNMDQPLVGDSRNTAGAGDHYNDVYFELTGSVVTTTPQKATIDAAADVGFGATASISSRNYSKQLYRGAVVNADYWYYIHSTIIHTTTALTNTNSQTDLAHYNVQVYRAISNKYGDKALNVTIPTGASYQITAASPAILPVGGGIVTFGGDVFTQKTYIRNRVDYLNSSFSGSLGWQQGLSFYSQNRVNTQMTNRISNPTQQWEYPATTLIGWLTEVRVDSNPIYNTGYNIKNGISRNAAFNPNLPDQNDLPTEIRWSDLKPQNAVVDNFRIFLPLNFKDLPLSWGEINDHVNFNGELFTLQPRMVQRQYFNTRGTMNVGGQSPTEVLIGDGSVMSRDGAMVTGIGTYHKWSVIKGKSAQGNDVLYWINTELKKVMRMGYDGTISIADIHGLQSYFANNLTWVIGKDTPANGQGICGVWDDRYDAAIWTVMGVRSFPAWTATNPDSSPKVYAKGDIVSGGKFQGNWSTYEQTGEIYISLANGNAGNDPTLSNVHWFLVPHQGLFTVTFTDTTTIAYNANQFYNEYTIEFNEQKNKFTTFYTFKPKIYLKWTDTFLTPQSKPSSNTGFVYQHRLGNYCSWYGDNQQEDASITLIYNQGINASKMFLSTWFYGIFDAANLLGPARLDVYTKRHQTFMLNTDSENNLDYFSVPIKNDILTSAGGVLNDSDTSKVFGEYVLIKVTFPYVLNVLQKMVDVVLKFFAQSRSSSK